MAVVELKLPFASFCSRVSDLVTRQDFFFSFFNKMTIASLRKYTKKSKSEVIVT